MKRQILMIITILMFSSSVFGQWFPAPTNVFVLPGQVRAEVFNPYLSPIICNGQVYGQTTYGQIFSSYFIEQFLVPGDFRFAFVQTTPFAPFVGGWANIQCRFATFFY